jgi:hypothetical protein
MRVLPPRRIALIPVIFLATVLSGCVASSTAKLAPTATATLTPTATPAHTASVSQVTQSQSGTNATAVDMSATAICPGGTTLVGGGYHLQLANNFQLVNVYADYPSAANAWTASEANPQSGGAVTLTVYADCLTANFAVTTSIVSGASVGGTGTATCPGGNPLVGGGYKQPFLGSNGMTASYPSGNAWNATAGQTTTAFTVYALCAANTLLPAETSTGTATVANNAEGEADTSCKGGELLVGGGFRLAKGAFILVRDFRLNDAVTAWMAKAYDLYIAPVVGGGGSPPPPPDALQVTAYAICVAMA